MAPTWMHMKLLGCVTIGRIEKLKGMLLNPLFVTDMKIAPKHTIRLVGVVSSWQQLVA